MRRRVRTKIVEFHQLEEKSVEKEKSYNKVLVSFFATVTLILRTLNQT